nr:proline-rich receptor-like protein kinase PERK10 [Lolium perenne]
MTTPPVRPAVARPLPNAVGAVATATLPLIVAAATTTAAALLPEPRTAAAPLRAPPVTTLTVEPSLVAAVATHRRHLRKGSKAPSRPVGQESKSGPNPAHGPEPADEPGSLGNSSRPGTATLAGRPKSSPPAWHEALPCATLLPSTVPTSGGAAAAAVFLWSFGRRSPVTGPPTAGEAANEGPRPPRDQPASPSRPNLEVWPAENREPLPPGAKARRRRWRSEPPSSSARWMNPSSVTEVAGRRRPSAEDESPDSVSATHGSSPASSSSDTASAQKRPRLRPMPSPGDGTEQRVPALAAVGGEQVAVAPPSPFETPTPVRPIFLSYDPIFMIPATDAHGGIPRQSSSCPSWTTSTTTRSWTTCAPLC